METEVQRIHDAVKLLGDAALDLATALSSLGSSGPTIAGTGTGLAGSPLTSERFSRMMSKEDVLPAPGAVVSVSGVVRDLRKRTLRVGRGKKMLFLTLECPGEPPTACKVVVPWGAYTADVLVGAEVRIKGTVRDDGCVWTDTIVIVRSAPQKVVAPVSYISGKPLGSKARRSKRVSAMVGASKAGYDYKHWCQMMRRVRVDNWKMDMRTFALMLDVTESAVRGWEQGVCFSRAATRWRLEQLTERAHSIKADSWKQSA